MSMTEFVTCDEHRESRVCPCGNTAETEGFCPSTIHGTPVEPHASDAGVAGIGKPWDGEHYVCLDCGLVHSQSDPAPNPTSTGPEDAFLLTVV